MEYTRVDFTFDNVSIAYLTCVEVNAAIACACCMTLKPLMMRVFPRLWGSRAGSAEARDVEAAAGSGGNRGPPTIGSRPSRMSTMEKRRNSWFGHMFYHRSNSNLQLLEEEEDGGVSQGKASLSKESEPESFGDVAMGGGNQIMPVGDPGLGRVPDTVSNGLA